MIVVTVDDVEYNTIPNDSSLCNACIAKNNPVLCVKLSTELNCSRYNVVFQPRNVNTPTEDIVNKPKHYQLVMKDDEIVEVREICEALASRLSSNGYSGMFISDYIQMLQYVLRFDEKNGKEDLDKAKWYLDKLLESL